VAYRKGPTRRASGPARNRRNSAWTASAPQRRALGPSVKTLEHQPLRVYKTFSCLTRMPLPTRPSRVQSAARTVAVGVVAGLAASWVKASSEPLSRHCSNGSCRPDTSAKDFVGADPTGQLERMRHAELAARLSRRFRHVELGRRECLKALKAIHSGLGAGLGVGYVVAARRWPATTLGVGAPVAKALQARSTRRARAWQSPAGPARLALFDGERDKQRRSLSDGAGHVDCSSERVDAVGDA
jgi:hypothetical protein